MSIVLTVSGVTPSLTLDRLAGHEPHEGAALGRDVCRCVHAHVDVLSDTGGITLQDSSQRAHGGEKRGNVLRLAAPPLTGGSEWSSYPQFHTGPPPARMVRSVIGASETAPLRPKGVTETQMRFGCSTRKFA